MRKTLSLPLSLPYFIAIIIDAIGFTIIAPLLIPLIHTLTSTTILNQHLLYGFILSIYSLSFMIGAPILGALSDLWGRRKVLMACSIGVMLGFSCYAFSLPLGSLGLLIAGRVITGLTAASQCIAQAAVIDLSHANNKTNNIGLIAAAMTGGLVLGPLMGGVLGSTQHDSWIYFGAPFYLVSLIALLNVLYLFYALKETHKTPSLEKERRQLKDQFQRFLAQFKKKEIATLLMIFLLFELGWSLYYQSLAIELPLNLHLQPKNLGLFLSFIGITLTLSLVLLIRISSRYFKLAHSIQYSLLAGVLAFVLQFFFTNLAWHYFFSIIISIAVGLSYTGLISLVSQHTSSDQQGLLMGTSDALLALAFSLTGLLAGYLAYLLPGLPLCVAAVFWLSAYILIRRRDVKD